MKKRVHKWSDLKKERYPDWDESERRRRRALLMARVAFAIAVTALALSVWRAFSG